MTSGVLRERYGGRIPRYTSYPTAPHFTDVTAEDLDGALAKVSGPVSLYLHIPFCQTLCWYCGCHQEIKKGREVAGPYVEAVLAEFDLLRDRTGGPLQTRQLALGGGSPTFLTPDQITTLMEGLTSRAPLAEGGEFSIEIDPRSADADYASTLIDLGFNRFSIGVQDFNPHVLKAVNREQDPALTEAILERIRQRGDYDVNIDLMYGLPHQTPDGFTDTIHRVGELRPSRISLFPYAHVPWMRPSQKLVARAGIPDTEARNTLLETAREGLDKVGYERVGMDHFALPGDALLAARDNGTLNRNFQGYTTLPDLDMLGLGVSSIGFYGGMYAQNTKDRAIWEAEIAAGRLPVERGVVLTDEDNVRRKMIMGLLCNGVIRWSDMPVTADLYASEIARLSPLVDDGLVQVDPDAVRLTQLGADFARNAAAAFDAYLEHDTSARRYSRSV